MLKTKHPNYDVLNLIGYGLAKFDKEFVIAFGAKTKQEFYKKMVIQELLKLLVRSKIAKIHSIPSLIMLEKVGGKVKITIGLL